MNLSGFVFAKRDEVVFGVIGRGFAAVAVAAEVDDGVFVAAAVGGVLADAQCQRAVVAVGLFGEF